MKIDLWADVACPWCYIGERRLRLAIEESGIEAQVRWRPYQLQPHLPPAGVPWDDFVERKFGGWTRAEGMFRHVAAAGATDGIQYDFRRVHSAPNTTLVHRLLLYAESHGRLWEAADAVFAAYFLGGRDVGDPAVLAELAGEAGLDPAAAAAMLSSDAYSPEVADALSEAAELGISGVPFVVLNDSFAVSGAQPLEIFREAIDRAREPG